MNTLLTPQDLKAAIKAAHKVTVLVRINDTAEQCVSITKKEALAMVADYSSFNTLTYATTSNDSGYPVLHIGV